MNHVFGNFTLGHLYSITFFLVPRFPQNLGFTVFVVFLLKEHFYSGQVFFYFQGCPLSGFSIVKEILI